LRGEIVYRHLLTVLLLVATIALYAAGAALPATGLLVLGALAEGTFWYRIFGTRKPAKK
jgi:hypothetical protein